ncbi:MAG: hypothetical protein LPJ91_02940 [Pseudazoarcus pumilus]|nr:hypothetical protein [Pseudazoarcus pumilus]
MKRRSDEQVMQILQRLGDKRLAPLKAPNAGERLRSIMEKTAARFR